MPSRLVSLQKKSGFSISFPNTMADKSCRLLEGQEASDFVASMDAFVFDCDGQ